MWPRNNQAVQVIYLLRKQPGPQLEVELIRSQSVGSQSPPPTTTHTHTHTSQDCQEHAQGTRLSVQGHSPNAEPTGSPDPWGPAAGSRRGDSTALGLGVSCAPWPSRRKGESIVK